MASNGTAAGTAMVQDILPGPFGSDPSQLVNFNGTLFFAANDGVHGVEPWVLGPVGASVAVAASPSDVEPASAHPSAGQLELAQFGSREPGALVELLTISNSPAKRGSRAATIRHLTRQAARPAEWWSEE